MKAKIIARYDKNTFENDVASYLDQEMSQFTLENVLYSSTLDESGVIIYSCLVILKPIVQGL